MGKRTKLQKIRDLNNKLLKKQKIEENGHFKERYNLLKLATVGIKKM